jgi:hypothetical protein
LFGKLDVGTMGDSHAALDPVMGIRVGILAYLVLADERVGHDDQSVIPRSNARSAQPDLCYVTPGVLALRLNPVPNAKRPVDQDDEAGDGVGDGIPRCQGDG